MWLLLLEAFMAMMVLVFIVWWTMFSGRKPDSPKNLPPAPLDDRGPPHSP